MERPERKTGPQSDMTVAPRKAQEGWRIKSTMLVGVIALTIAMTAILLLSVRPLRARHTAPNTATVQLMNATLTAALADAMGDMKARLPVAVDTDAAGAGGAPCAAWEKAKAGLPDGEARLLEKKLQANYSQVWMSAMELDMLLRYMRSVRTYLEWGSGGSTLNVARYAQAKAVSIEHAEAWCGQMRDALGNGAEFSHVDYHCVPVARGHKGWGQRHGFEEGNYDQFREYVDEIDNVGQDSYDLILVDGRARVACAVKALSYLAENGILVIHDAGRIFSPTSSASDYRAVLTYYEPTDMVTGPRRQGIVMLKVKKEWRQLRGDREAVQTILDTKFSKR